MSQDAGSPNAKAHAEHPLPSWWDLTMAQRFWFSLGVDAVDPAADAEGTYAHYFERLARDKAAS